MPLLGLCPGSGGVCPNLRVKGHRAVFRMMGGFESPVTRAIWWPFFYILKMRFEIMTLSKIILLALFIALNAPILASINTAQAGDVHVRGHYRSNGIYVAPHTRSAPDGNPYNNYSYGR